MATMTQLQKRPRYDASGGDYVKHPQSNVLHFDLTQRHLYLIFDDWVWGYSIRKVDLLLDGKAEPGNYSTERPPPEVIFRLPAPRGSPLCFAQAFNGIIMAMHPPWGPLDEVHPLVMKTAVPAFEVPSQSVVFCPRPKGAPSNPIYIFVRDKLLALSSRSLELLESKSLPETHPLSALAWCKLPDPPFDSKFVTSHTLHPDGRTLLFSVVENTNRAGAITTKINVFTFSLHMGQDMEVGSFRWQLHGHWMMPFIGRAYFVPELETWVGLARYPKIGHLCSCDAVSPSIEAKKISKEKLFSGNLDETHVGATLVCMGGSNFCLVQCIKKYNKNTQHQEGRYMYRVSTFSLKYDKHGNLTYGKSLRVEYYRVPESSTELLVEQPVAFWM